MLFLEIFIICTRLFAASTPYINTHIPHSGKWRDETGEGNYASISEQPGHFANTPYVLFSILRGEAEVLVKT